MALDEAKVLAALSKEDHATLATARSAKEFLDSKFGKFYLGLLQSALEAKRMEYEGPAEVSFDGISQVLRAESAKGAIMGLRLALSLLSGMVTAGDNLRKQKGLSASAGETE